MLELHNVKKTFNKGTINEKKALQGLELTLQSEDFVTIIGGNGAGNCGGISVAAQQMDKRRLAEFAVSCGQTGILGFLQALYGA